MRTPYLLKGGYALFLLVTGWIAGRQFQPFSGEASPAAAAGSGGGAAAFSGSPLIPGKKTDPAAAALEARGSSGENAVRDAARRMALTPPPALEEFLAIAADTDALRAALREDAVFWAFCRNPAAGLAQLSVLPDLVGKTLHFFPPKDLPLVLDWYHKLPAGPLRLTALQQINPVLARRDPAKAAALRALSPP